MLVIYLKLILITTLYFYISMVITLLVLASPSDLKPCGAHILILLILLMTPGIVILTSYKLPLFFNITLPGGTRMFLKIFLLKIKTILARLTGIQNSAKYATSSFLQNLEISLIKDFNDILRLEEEFWKLKSRINWITDGDANAKFFHISTINRRRRNCIISFIDDTGNLIYDQADIDAHIFNYFKALYSTIHLDAANHYNHYPFFILTDSDKIHLGKDLCDHEILEALKSFKPFKAPRPDGLHPFFYKKY